MARILFQNCALLDSTYPELREGFHVLVENGRITEISESAIKAGDGQVIDLKGRTLMPGLIDAHVHVTAVKADLGSQIDLPGSLIAVKTREIMEAMLMRGFTTVRDAGGADWGFAEAVKQGLIKGPRLLFSGKALSQTGGHGDGRSKNNNLEGCACEYGTGTLSKVVDGVTEVRKAARNELRKGASQIKIMAGGGVASPTDHIANTQYSLEEIRAVVEEAEASRTYVMAHAYTARAIRRAVECGVRSIEHGNLVDHPTAEFMAERGAFMVPTMSTYEMLYQYGAQMGFPAVSLKKLDEVRLLAVEALDICKKAGVKIGHGSDLLGDMHRYQSLEFTLKAQVLTPHEAITCATNTNAELLNMTGEIGVLTPGAYADLLVVDGNPLKDLNLLQEQGRYLKLIMREGEIFKNEL
jgi:imidazolonepropionase-like amidohydrolase